MNRGSHPAAVVRMAELIGTRQRIVAAARDLVADGGWSNAQVALAAGRAGVATGSVYRHFASKADLYAEVLAAVSRREIDVVRQTLAAGGSASERLTAAVRVFVVRAVRGRRLAYALIAEPCDPEIDRERVKYRKALAGEFARIIREGTRTREFAVRDDALAASCVTGAFMEALVGPLAPGARRRSADVQAFAAAVSDLCLRIVVRRPTARRR